MSMIRKIIQRKDVMVLNKLFPVIKRLLFALEPEYAHDLAMKGLHLLTRSNPYDPIICNPRECMGLIFKNPVGLAAGFDKNANYIHSLSGIGFGFIEVGTITPRPQKGNPRPRLFRLEKDEAIINRMGFNNDGMAVVAKRLERCNYSGILGVNIGKNKDTHNDKATEDYEACMTCLAPHADYFVINVSSPNTPGLRDLQEIKCLEKLLTSVQILQKRLQHTLKKPLPLVVKLAPDADLNQQTERLKLVRDLGLEGVVMSNTTVSRPALQGKQVEEKGGLSGAPLTALSSDMLKVAKQILGRKVALIASGGVMSSEDAMEKMAFGADLVQLYTGLVYRGPALVNEILTYLMEHQQACA